MSCPVGAQAAISRVTGSDSPIRLPAWSWFTPGGELAARTLYPFTPPGMTAMNSNGTVPVRWNTVRRAWRYGHHYEFGSSGSDYF